MIRTDGTDRPIRLLGASLLLAWAGLVSAEPSPRELWHQSIESGYQALADSANRLRHAAESYCTAPGNTRLDRVRSQWQSTFLAWQAIRFVDFGPIERNSRAWQIQFWPDTRNLVAHKAQGWLKATGEITSKAIAEDGVAVQGLPILEYLLFDADLQTSSSALPASRPCGLLTSVAGHLADTTADVVTDWKALEPVYLSDDQFTTDTFNAARTMLDTLQDKRLETPMGVRGGQQPNPYLADAWRSGQSVAAMKASLSGLDRYFLPGLRILMTNAGETGLFRDFQHQMDAALAAFKPLPDGLKMALASDQDSRSLQSLLVQVSELRMLLAGPVADSLGIIRGFNSSDGD